MINVLFEYLGIIFKTVFTLLPEMIKGMFAISDAIENVQIIIVAAALGVSVPVAWVILKLFSFAKDHLI